ncbi:MAG: WD40 repeat domain-containing protein [Gemmataceae bacterium]
MLRLVDVPGPFEKHDGEVYSCSYSPDGAYLLSAGWDGLLRLWDASTGGTLSSLAASPRPLSACAYSGDGKQWLSGSMEGLLCTWDSVSHQMIGSFVAHTRPISGLSYSPDGRLLATASWDRQVAVRNAEIPRESRTFGTHHDIVSGCRFGADGSQLFSWSHDSTIKVWDVASGREAATFAGHSDRVTTLAISPDGRMALSGGRDATVRMWDLEQMAELATVNIGAEVRACFFLLDGESVIIADAVGRLFLMTAPAFQVRAQIQTPFRAMSGALSPNGLQIALGSEEGIVHFLDIEGQDEASFVVTATQSLKEESTVFGMLFGGTRTTRKYTYTCPSCRQVVESVTLPPGPVPCPRCHRQLRIRQRVAVTA